MASDDRQNRPNDLGAKWLRENLPSGVGAVRLDGDALDAWCERNPDATMDEIRQVAFAPDHVLDVVDPEGEEEEDDASR